MGGRWGAFRGRGNSVEMGSVGEKLRRKQDVDLLGLWLGLNEVSLLESIGGVMGISLREDKER